MEFTLFNIKELCENLMKVIKSFPRKMNIFTHALSFQEVHGCHLNPLEPLLFLAVSTEYLVHRAASGKYMGEIQHSEFGGRKAGTAAECGRGFAEAAALK